MYTDLILLMKVERVFLHKVQFFEKSGRCKKKTQLKIVLRIPVFHNLATMRSDRDIISNTKIGKHQIAWPFPDLNREIIQ